MSIVVGLQEGVVRKPGVYVSRVRTIESTDPPRTSSVRRQPPRVPAGEIGDAGASLTRQAEAKAAPTRPGEAVTSPRFSEAERQRLLLASGIGPRVVEHLERAGFTSLADMRAMGAKAVVVQVSQSIGGIVVANRVRALARAMDVDACC